MSNECKPKCGECADEECRLGPRCPDSPFDPNADADPDCFIPKPGADPSPEVVEMVARAIFPALCDVFGHPLSWAAAEEGTKDAARKVALQAIRAMGGKP
jgi:hypothetical protein